MYLILKLMINRIKKYIIDKKLFLQTDNLLLAISGGADSVFLFFILHRLGYNIQLAHCNFNLRGRESDEDEHFVRNLANKYNVKFYIKSFETKTYAKKKKISIQMAAREIRYKWFNKLLAKYNLDFVITGHHKDDNVETFLINLIRGSGINGLSGIKPINKNVIRPLLEVTKIEILHFLKQKGIKYRNDSSNYEIKYLRNRIRQELIPLLEDINPKVKDKISDEVFLLENIRKIFLSHVDRIRTRLLFQQDDIYKLNISELNKLDNLEVILYEILHPFGFSEIHQIQKSLFSQSGTRFFSNKYQLIIDRDFIVISLLDTPQNDIKILEIDTEINNPLRMRFSLSTNCLVDKSLNVAQLDFEKLTFPLKLRKWKYGDKFVPLGMTNFKKLSDFFIDKKYTILDKKKQWILCSKDDVVWIVGQRIDDRYKIETNTKKVYIAELL